MTVDLTQRLKDRVAIITGGASGIGLATARRFAAEGARVVIADLDPASGEAAASEVGRRVPPRQRRRRGVGRRALRRGRSTEFGRLDIAFNNAGISPADDDSIETTELPAWDRVQDVNLKSVYLCSRAALRHMVPQGAGSIINTASFVALLGSATSQISYTASKGGVLAMTRELGVQFARQGIRVNALCPGPGEHAAAAGAVRQGPRARAAPARARADGPLRRAGGARRRRRLPRLGRRVVHHRHRLRRRRRHHQRLRHAALSGL